MILSKLVELKKQNRSIEEIYKYTNNIIFEEEDEGEDEDGKGKLRIQQEKLSRNEDGNLS